MKHGRGEERKEGDILLTAKWHNKVQGATKQFHVAGPSGVSDLCQKAPVKQAPAYFLVAKKSGAVRSLLSQGLSKMISYTHG